MTDAAFHFPVRVYYEDTDAGGVVYHANYLRFMERARTEWLRDLGYEQDDLIDEHRFIFAVKKIQLDYKRPAQLNNELLVTARISNFSRISIEFKQTIEKQELELCEGNIMIVGLDSETFKPKRLPAKILKEIERVCSN